MNAALQALWAEISSGLEDGLQNGLRRAYELGYREALATLGSPRRLESAAEGDQSGGRTAGTIGPGRREDRECTEPLPCAAPAANLGPAAASTPDQPERDGGDDDDEVQPDSHRTPLYWEDDEPPEPEAATVISDGFYVKPIKPNATVATLRYRIFKVFGLERYDVDVIVCRKGDPARRQLKGSTRLSRYLLEQ